VNNERSGFENDVRGNQGSKIRPSRSSLLGREYYALNHKVLIGEQGRNQECLRILPTTTPNNDLGGRRREETRSERNGSRLERACTKKDDYSMNEKFNLHNQSSLHRKG